MLYETELAEMKINDTDISAYGFRTHHIDEEVFFLIIKNRTKHLI